MHHRIFVNLKVFQAAENDTKPITDLTQLKLRVFWNENDFWSLMQFYLANYPWIFVGRCCCGRFKVPLGDLIKIYTSRVSLSIFHELINFYFRRKEKIKSLIYEKF